MHFSTMFHWFGEHTYQKSLSIWLTHIYFLKESIFIICAKKRKYIESGAMQVWLFSLMQCYMKENKKIEIIDHIVNLCRIICMKTTEPFYWNIIIHNKYVWIPCSKTYHCICRQHMLLVCLWFKKADRFQTINSMKTRLPSDKNIEFNVKKCKINCIDLWITIDYDSYTNGKNNHHIFQKRIQHLYIGTPGFNTWPNVQDMNVKVAIS